MTSATRWERCDADGANCVLIAGASGTSYVVDTADIGSTIRMAVTQTSSIGSTTAESVATAVVGPKAPPVNDTAPSISGPLVDGLTLTASDGAWSGTPSISTKRRWQICDAAGNNCVDDSTTGTTLKLTSTDVGSTYRVVVTATNPDGVTTATSAATAPIQPAPPTTSGSPTISGSVREGQVLSAATGSWKGTPTITYAYQWNRCASGSCTPISGATSSTYRVDPIDVGMTLTVEVTASNAGGTQTATSSPTVTVTPGPPINVDLPQVSGALPRDGQVYSSTLGTWAGTGPLTYNRQWLRCSNTGSSCQVISGEIGTTYTLTGTDVGKTVRIRIVAANAQGTATIDSPASPLISATPPVIAGGKASIGGVPVNEPLVVVIVAPSRGVPLSTGTPVACGASAATSAVWSLSA
jgi:hypothetical protein